MTFREVMNGEPCGTRAIKVGFPVNDDGNTLRSFQDIQPFRVFKNQSGSTIFWALRKMVVEYETFIQTANIEYDLTIGFLLVTLALRYEFIIYDRFPSPIPLFILSFSKYLKNFSKIVILPLFDHMLNMRFDLILFEIIEH
jgi:hypothetical protein